MKMLGQAFAVLMWFSVQDGSDASRIPGSRLMRVAHGDVCLIL